MAPTVVDEALRIHGGAGYLKSHPTEYLYSSPCNYDLLTELSGYTRRLPISLAGTTSPGHMYVRPYIRQLALNTRVVRSEFRRVDPLDYVLRFQYLPYLVYVRYDGITVRTYHRCWLDSDSHIGRS